MSRKWNEGNELFVPKNCLVLALKNAKNEIEF